jgi:hypothetical protein
VIIPLDLTQLSCPGFTLAAGLPSVFTTDGVGCWGGGSPVESLQSYFILTMSHWSSGLTLASRHKGPEFKSSRGYLCETGVLLLAMSRYNIIYTSKLFSSHSYIPILSTLASFAHNLQGRSTMISSGAQISSISFCSRGCQFLW